MDASLLAGNGPLKRQLDAQTAKRGFSHAYILAGPAGSGKRTLARILAAALVCSGQAEEHRPCRRCGGCKKVFSGIHPDVIAVGDDGKDLSVAQVRALRADAYIRPNEARRKVYLLHNAQSMNPSAQNAMLKLLEEGPAYAAFLLLTDNAAALLPTVRSRCETLTLSPVAPEEAEAYLLRRYPDMPRDLVLGAAARCEGLIGRAVEFLEGGGDEQAREGALSLLHALIQGDELSLMEFSAALEKWDRDHLSALFGETILLLRSALILHAHGDPGEPDPQRRDAAALAAHSLPPRRILACVEVLERLRAACGFNTGAGHLAGWLCAALSPISYRRTSHD